MPRIPVLSPETMDAAQLKVYREILGGPRQRLVGLLNTVLHSPDLADLWQKFGAFVRFSTSVPPRLGELAILVTSRRWNSQVEWYVHSECARAAGLPESVIEAIQHGDPPDFDSADDAAVYEYARELQGTGQVSPTVYGAVLTQLGAAGIVELTAIIGYYTLVAITLNAHDIPVPDGAAPPLAGVGRSSGGRGEFVELTALPPARGAGPSIARTVLDNRRSVIEEH